MVKIKIKGLPKAPKKKKAIPPTKTVVALRERDQLDEGARKWLRLLADPCGAELAEPAYGSTGTGYLMRCRNLISAPATATDYVIEISPSFGPNGFARYGWSASQGGSLGNAGFYPVGAMTASYIGRARCVACCAKVIYTGTEVNRQGNVGALLDNGVTMTVGEALTGTAADWASNCPKIYRLGTENIELRWVPSQEDAAFAAVSAEEFGTASNPGGNSIQLALWGVTPGAFMIDVTSVWEWQPAEEVSSGTGLISGMRAPPSSTPFNTIIRALGDLGKFAYHQVGGAEGIARGIQGAFGTSPAYARAAMALL